MKVLHLTTYPYGGAGIAARRISEALFSKGLSSRCRSKENDRQNLSLFYRIKVKLRSYLLMRLSRTGNPILRSGGISSAHIVDEINASDADIVHLHWINQDFLSIKDIAKITTLTKIKTKQRNFIS